MRLSPAKFDQALAAAQKRGFLPSRLGSAQLAQVITPAVRERCLVLARGTNARFLQAVVQAIVEARKGGPRSAEGYLIAGLQRVLQALGYDPATGFPGDAAQGVPSAEAGSLQDLSSRRRLLLILNTERQLAQGKAQQINGNTPVMVEQAPAWQLVRMEDRRVPRDSPDSGSLGWGERWLKAGGPGPFEEDHKTILAARKDDPVWQLLGSTTLFKDGLNVSHPPFAFNSGMGLLPVTKERWERFLAQGKGGKMLGGARGASKRLDIEDQAMPPAPQAEKQLPQAADEALKAKMLAAIMAGRRELGITQVGGAP